MLHKIGRPMAVAVLVSVAAGACHDAGTGPNAPTAPQISSAHSSFTGQDFYRGIVFAHGPVADLVPQIRSHMRIANWVDNPQQLRAIEDLQDRIIAQIDKGDPGFFESFALAVRSGNPLLIDRALVDAARVTRRAVSRMPEIEALRKELRANPQLLEDIKERGAARARERRVDEATYREAMEATLASVLDPAERSDPPQANIVSVFAAVAVFVGGITVLLVQSYAAVFNVAGAINFYLAVAAVGPGVEGLARVAGTNDLKYEQMVESIAETFGTRRSR